MKLLICIYFSFISIFGIKAQNLVKNSGFELYYECPQNVANLNLSIGWVSPTKGTPDYFNQCDTLGSTGVPYNIFGNKKAFEGKAYAGFCIMDIVFARREYIQTDLIRTLEKGELLDISLQVSRADYSRLFIDRIGICFSNEKPKILTIKKCIDTTMKGASDCEIIKCKNKILLKSDSLLNDKENWILLKAIYEAKGGEKVLTIGLFDGDILEDDHVSYIENYINEMTAQGKTSSAIELNLRKALAYYFIDDIRIEKRNYTHY